MRAPASLIRFNFPLHPYQRPAEGPGKPSHARSCIIRWIVYVRHRFLYHTPPCWTAVYHNVMPRWLGKDGKLWYPLSEYMDALLYPPKRLHGTSMSLVTKLPRLSRSGWGHPNGVLCIEIWYHESKQNAMLLRASVDSFEVVGDTASSNDALKDKDRMGVEHQSGWPRGKR